MRGFRIGKIFGINIHIDWSWLLIFGLVSWGLASSFGQLHADWTTPANQRHSPVAGCTWE